MILKDKLYIPITRTEEFTPPSYGIRLNPECFIYKAHFPGHPVTPGVCLVQIALEVLEYATKRSLKIKRMKEAKFLSVVSPDSCLELCVNIIKLDETDGELSAKMTIEDYGGEVKAKISLCCE